jgi:hypothetical protein
MFDDLLRELKHLEQGVTISVPIGVDADGYADKECPNPECLAAFKVHAEDWVEKVSDDVVYCPICRHEADSEQWFTTAQIENAHAIGVEELLGQVDQAMARGAKSASRRALSSGFISFSLDFKPGHRTFTAPLSATEVLEQRTTCETCGTRFASIGAAFFCPACGHNSAPSTCADTLATVRDGLDIPGQLQGTLDRDLLADLDRGIRENGLVKLVTAFQRYAEASYDALPDPKVAPPFNAFQRLDDGSDLFTKATGRRFGSVLTAAELDELRRFFQQRHVLVHQDGIVDQQYVDRSGDQSYGVGQRLVVRADAVRRAAELIERLAASIV